jgi:Phosphosulfolactate phosphohydrolase and related enzymes
MKINLMPRTEDIHAEEVEGTNAIVIDMLRATSVITEAVKNGANEVIPVLTIEEALKLKEKNKDVILGGERKGVRIEGFDGGNSPLEYTPEFVGGKTLVITTSNGTRAVNACIKARNIFIGSMLNGSAAAKRASIDGIDISIACAGTQGRFSLDDFVCAGYIIDEILKVKEFELTDISFLAHHTYLENKGNIRKFISNASHYDYLVKIGAKEDIDYCCNMGIINMVPVFKEGSIKA